MNKEETIVYAVNGSTKYSKDEYMNCPHCGKPINIFGESKIESYAASKGINILGRIPLDPAISALCDNGKIEDINDDYLDSLKYILKEMAMQ